ncbi:hypothetical protein [Paraglaciecola sp.]|uniref:hypothetical protein n=1 Tax=Paraglaciecola sp. TaxID=1920173 RepID=UPI00273DD79C|nr:hypothetical protein [Paraglaciecola sp.]MDP5031851.1 hypothetical protein [Paraglaciecola sp.]
MFKNFEMTFSRVCNEYVQEQYKQASLIVEYGSGGSTLLAAKLNKKIITVESSNTWLLELVGAAAHQKLKGTIIPLWVDVGPTGEWGAPKDDTRLRNWINYSRAPWQYCNQNKLVPDLVLIDGRFRVACFLAVCASIQRETIILFDDYEERPHYFLAEKLFKKIDVIDKRMAVFKIKPNMLSSQDLLENMHYFNDLN